MDCTLACCAGSQGLIPAIGKSNVQYSGVFSLSVLGGRLKVIEPDTNIERSSHLWTNIVQVWGMVKNARLLPLLSLFNPHSSRKVLLCWKNQSLMLPGEKHCLKGTFWVLPVIVVSRKAYQPRTGCWRCWWRWRRRRSDREPKCGLFRNPRRRLRNRKLGKSSDRGWSKCRKFCCELSRPKRRWSTSERSEVSEIELFSYLC